MRVFFLKPNDAAQLYLESEYSITKREALLSQLKLAAASQTASKGRPGKQERRKIIRFTQSWPACQSYFFMAAHVTVLPDYDMPGKG